MTGEWHSDIYGVRPHPSTSRVLTVPREGAWSLPGAQAEGRIELTPRLVTRTMSRVLGRSVVAYWHAVITRDKRSGREEGMFALDDPECTADPPRPGRWLDREDLSELQLSRPHHRGVIDEHLRELETGIVPEFRQPWERRSWVSLAASTTSRKRGMGERATRHRYGSITTWRRYGRIGVRRACRGP